jgi:hypothetical protein
MSAFIVGRRTINRVVTYIKREAEKDESFNVLVVRKALDVLAIKTWDELVQAMFDMNIEAVDYRYKENNTQAIIKHTDEPVDSLYQVLSSLDCFLYQCNEGKVPEKPLFQFLGDVQHHILRAIVYTLPEYEKAEWG